MLRNILAASAAFLILGSGAALADCGRSDAGGTILGAVAGGLLGGAVSHGNGGAVVGGALLGGLAGNAISRDMDCEDRPYAARSYDDSFHGQIGRRYEWNRGPDRGYIVTNREYRGPRGRSAATSPRWSIAMAASSTAMARPACGGTAAGISCRPRTPKSTQDPAQKAGFFAFEPAFAATEQHLGNHCPVSIAPQTILSVSWRNPGQSAWRAGSTAPTALSRCRASMPRTGWRTIRSWQRRRGTVSSRRGRYRAGSPVPGAAEEPQALGRAPSRTVSASRAEQELSTGLPSHFMPSSPT